MKKVYTLLAIGFFIYVAIGLTYRLHEDFSHPESWGSDPATDPRIYLAAWGLVPVLAIVLVWREHRRQLREHARWDKLENAARQLIEERRREDN